MKLYQYMFVLAEQSTAYKGELCI